MKLSEVLWKSFSTLREEPKIFVPKLFSTALSSVLVILLLEGAFKGFLASNLFLGFSLVLGALLVLILIGVVASLMVASMVKNRGSDRLLLKGLKEALEDSRKLVLATAFILGVSFAVSLVVGFSVAFYRLSGSLLPLVAAALFGVLVLVAVSFASYFLPITLLEMDSFSSGLRESFRSSKNNSREVMLLLVFSLGMLGLAFFSSGYLEIFGYLGFLAGRFVSTVVNTYFFVVSPTYYLES